MQMHRPRKTRRTPNSPIATGVYYKHDYKVGGYFRYKNIPFRPLGMAAKNPDFDLVVDMIVMRRSELKHESTNHISAAYGMGL